MQMANNGFPKTPIVRYGCIILYVATKAVYGTINLRILDDNILLWGWRTMILLTLKLDVLALYHWLIYCLYTKIKFEGIFSSTILMHVQHMQLHVLKKFLNLGLIHLHTIMNLLHYTESRNLQIQSWCITSK